MDDAIGSYQKVEVASALADGPFRGALSTGAPIVVVAGAPARVRWASDAALALFECETLGALSALLVDAESPGARRLRRLAETNSGPTAPRLEQLRFYGRGAPMALSLLAACIEGYGDEPWLVLAANVPTGSEAFSPSPLLDETPVQERSIEKAPVEAPAQRPAPAQFAAPPLDGPVRFLWSLDAEGRFFAVDPALEARLGANAAKTGELLSDLIERVDLDPAWRERVAARKTFSSLRLEWPEPGRARARVIKISGAPTLDRAREFSGFQGFGVFTGEGVERFVAASPEPQVPREAVPDEVVDAPIEPLEPEATANETQTRAGAEIFVLRPGATAANNVIPIRPNAVNVLASFAEPVGKTDSDGSVELNASERDAFREIARALGARARDGAVEQERIDPLPSEERLEPEEPQPPDGELSALIDALPIGALVCRGDETLFVNKGLLDFTGYESLAAFRSAGALAKMFRGRAPETLLEAGEDTPVVGANSELKIVHARASAIVWGGEPATLVSLRRSRDVEHQERAISLEAESLAHASRARDLLVALDVACDGFVRLDANGRILSMSPRAETSFGYDQKETAGANFLTLLAPQSQAQGLSAFLDVIGAEFGRSAPAEIEAQARTSSGRDFAAGIAFGRMAGSDPPEAFFVIHDRESAGQRELSGARESAVKANERKTEFLAVVSHEIRTPLQAILGFAEVMMAERFGPVGNERYKEYIKDIYASGRLVISLANDLIDLVKIESGKMELVFEPVDANRTIRDCVALMQPQAARERIIMRMSLSDRLPNVMADARSLRQIMLNLMSNAVKFNEPGGQVIVSTALDEAGAVVIRVRDTGVGMSESELDVALEPFRRAEGGKIADGIGLGLPLTKALVEANHADFSIKSRKEQGTLVEVAFASVRAAQ